MDRKIAVKFDNFMGCNITSHCVLVKTKVKYQEEKNYYYIQGRRNIENLCREKHSLFIKSRDVAKGGPGVFGKLVNPIQTRGADYARHTTARPPPRIQKAIYTSEK